MFITKRHLPRRTFLKGMGVTLALPLLEAMIPARTALANTAAAPRPRMAFIYFPHGAVMDKWTPAAEGSDFDLPPILEPLAPFRRRLTVVSGLENKAALAAPVHSTTPGTWLGCVPPRIGHDPYGAITADQVAAQHIGQESPLPSLEVATEEQGAEGSSDGNFGCSYGNTISFSTPSTPLPMEHDPRKVFQRLFGNGNTPEERARIAHGTTSILDLVKQDAADLERKLGARDRALLAEHLDTVRDIERRVAKLAQRDLSHADLPERLDSRFRGNDGAAPAGSPDSFGEHMNLMFDLIAVAFQANLTRIASFMMAAEVSNQTYSHIGIPDAFHPLSHHANNAAKLERLSRIQIYHSQIFAKFVQKLAQTPDGESSMLDNAIVLYGSNMSDSNLHNHFPLPTAVVGGGCGRIKGNQHLRYPDRTPIANLHLTLLNRAGIPLETLGDSAGQFADL